MGQQEAPPQEGQKPEIHITPPGPPEVDPRIYRDVEPILFRGFLTVRAEINAIPFVFKSLNHHEFEMVQLVSGDFETMTERSYNLFLAYGVFLVDGGNALLDREKWLPELADMFKEMPASSRVKLIRNLSEINRRSANATRLVEAYALERTSRFRWNQYYQMDMTSPAVTGVLGTGGLGVNWGQLLWRAMNLYEDQKERSEGDWENAKFIGGCFVGKGMSKINGQDSDRRQKEADERIARKDKIIRQVLLGKSSSEEVLGSGAIIQVAHTVEELAKQLEADLRGEKDFHDLVVEGEEKRIREQTRARQQQIQQLHEEARKRFEGAYMVGGTDLSGMTERQAKEHMERRRQMFAQAVARQMMMYPEGSDPRASQFLDKWGISKGSDPPKGK